MDEPRKRGGTLRQIYTSAWRQLRRKPKALEGPPAPPGADTILRAFGDLRAAAGRDGMSGAPIPIAFAAINEWAKAMRTPLHPDEVRAIRALDEARLAFEAELRAKPETMEED